MWAIKIWQLAFRHLHWAIGGIKCPISRTKLSNKLNLGAIFSAIALIAMPCQAATLRVWLTNPLNRVKLDTVIDENFSQSEEKIIKIEAARNEYEPFQIVIRANDEEVTGVRIDMTPLVSQTRCVIPAESVKIYLEHYIYVSKSTPRSSLTFGWFPDALIPWRENSNCTIAPKCNQPFWGEVHIPADIEAGLYTGSIRISANGCEPVELNLELKIWNFTLNNPSLQTSFGLSYEQISNYHHLRPGSIEYWEMIRKYNQILIEHRLMPTCLITPRALPDGSFDTTNLTPLLSYYFDTLGVNASMYAFNLNSPFADPLGEDSARVRMYLETYYRYLLNHGWAERHYVYLIDEPNDSIAYQQVRQYGEFIHRINPKIKMLCTEQVEPQNPNWGKLSGYVDIYCPIFFLYDSAQAHWRQSLGDEIWAYTACTQGNVPTPWWQLDMPLMNYRIVPWMLRRNDISGLLYWSTNYWQESPDPWLNPAGFKNQQGDFWNGDGSLFYPGDNVGIAGPVASLRLKQLREGMEDYEYLVILSAMGEVDFAKSQIQRLTKDFFSWRDNPESLNEIRKTIGEKIAAINSVAERDSINPMVEPFVINISPNPFTRSTMIKYRRIDSKNAQLKIYDITGKLVTSLKLNQVITLSSWDGKDWNGKYVAKGIYWVRVESEVNHYAKVIFIRP